MTIRAVLFDLNGTLLQYFDPKNGHVEQPFRRIMFYGVYKALTARSGCRPHAYGHLHSAVLFMVDKHTREMSRTLAPLQLSGSIDTVVRAIMAELGCPVDDAEWAELRPIFYSEIEPRVVALNGAKEILETLRDAGIKTGLVTNTRWPAEMHDRFLARHDLLDLLPMRLYSCDFPHTKPHASIFQEGLRRMELTPENTIFVGDRPNIDILGAHNAGMRGVRVMPTYENIPESDIVPDAVIEELPQLTGVLDAWEPGWRSIVHLSGGTA